MILAFDSQLFNVQSYLPYTKTETTPNSRVVVGHSLSHPPAPILPDQGHTEVTVDPGNIIYVENICNHNSTHYNIHCRVKSQLKLFIDIHESDNRLLYIVWCIRFMCYQSPEGMTIQTNPPSLLF